MEGLPTEVPGGASGIAAIAGALLLLIGILAKAKGWLVFEKDETALRKDLMAALAAERLETQALGKEIKEARDEIGDLRVEIVRLQMFIDTQREQFRFVFGLLEQVKAGVIAPAAIVLPAPPAPPKEPRQ